MNIINWVLLVFILFFQGCYLIRRIPKESAVFKAEDFINKQGFTANLINFDSTKTRIDINEVDLTKEEIAKWRYKSLNPKAVYATKYGLGWLVAFTPTNISLATYHNSNKISTRAVIVSRNGRKIHIEHQSFLVNKNKIIK